MLKEFFFFSKGERNGVYVLGFLLTLMLGVNFCMPVRSGEEERVAVLAQTANAQPAVGNTPSPSSAPPAAVQPVYCADSAKTNVECQDTFRRTSYNEKKNQKQYTKDYPKRKAYPRFNYDTVRIEINRADTTEWKRLRGIGTVLSARIVKYRTKIGGFKSVEQLQKIYGLSEETYQSILPHLYMEGQK